MAGIVSKDDTSISDRNASRSAIPLQSRSPSGNRRTDWRARQDSEPLAASAASRPPSQPENCQLLRRAGGWLASRSSRSEQRLARPAGLEPAATGLEGAVAEPVPFCQGSFRVFESNRAHPEAEGSASLRGIHSTFAPRFSVDGMRSATRAGTISTRLYFPDNRHASELALRNVPSQVTT